MSDHDSSSPNWTGQQWTLFVDAWMSETSLPKEMTAQCPAWFHPDGRINKENKSAIQALNRTTALMWSFTLHVLCEKHRVHLVDVEISHDPMQSSVTPPYIGTAVNPLEIRLLIDKPSYPSEQIAQLHDVLDHVLLKILHKRGGYCLYLRLDDVLDFPQGYEGPWRLNGTSPLRHGLHQPEVLQDNPQVLHGWRSRQVAEDLLAGAASGGIAQRGELYLRWLDGIQTPGVMPLNESAIENHWPGALNFFRMWSSLGIHERNALREVLDGLDKPVESTYSLPDSLSP